MPKAMIVSVGGTLSPIIFSLNKQEPQYIVFFASKVTESQIIEIERELVFKPISTERIITSSAEIMEECYAVIKERLPSIIERWGIKSLVADYTGGTKSMSTALVLATLDFCKKYSYIGGRERTKEGLGVVIDGREKMLYIKNPWDKFAIFERREISSLFNRCRYDSCLEILEKLRRMVSKEERSYYDMWLEIIKGYSLWDKFEHNEAYYHLNKGFQSFKIYGIRRKNESRLLKHIERNLNFLKEINNSDEKLILDLVANAERRAEQEGKFDDSVARLYRASEKFAQALLKRMEINSSNVREEDIPASIRREFKSRYTDLRDNRIKLPLEASYRLLKEKGDKFGEKFIVNYEKIRNLLDIRNNSILAHGDRPVKENTYRDLMNLLIDFCEIKIKQLPDFPVLRL